MAGLNCGVTLARLGALLLGAALLPRGAGGECGSASARGTEWPRWPASLPRAGRGRRCAREGGCRVGAGTAQSGGTDGAGCPGLPGLGARRVGRCGLALLDSERRRSGRRRGHVRMSPSTETRSPGDQPDVEQRKERRARGRRAPGRPKWLDARSGSLPGLLRAPGQAGPARELSSLVHPLPPAWAREKVQGNSLAP